MTHETEAKQTNPTELFAALASFDENESERAALVLEKLVQRKAARGVWGKLKSTTFEQVAAGITTALVLAIGANDVMLRQEIAGMSANVESINRRAERVEQIADRVATREDVELMISARGPWQAEQPDWLRWRNAMDGAVLELVATVRSIGEQLDIMKKPRRE